MNIFEQAEKNRTDFLEPHRLKIAELQKNAKEPGKTKAELAKIDNEIEKIVVKLIKTEPSHLNEPWIREIVISWARDFERLDTLEAAFLAQKGRDRPTPDEYSTWAKWLLFRHQVRDLVRGGMNTTTAIEKLRTGSGVFGQHDNDYLWRKYYEKEKPPVLPWPYLGRDVWQEPDGTWTIRGKGIIEIELASTPEPTE